ncbi:YcjF family protein [Lusitaniella coriacea]|uniref:YcjF family protein n=1 Tax=Lusitaniella coriacea TaxID=1983105 RepID=UPI003CF655E2
MAIKLRKPILVGGMGLSFGLWVWWNLQDSLMEAGEFGMFGAIALGGGLWLLRRNSSGTTLSQEMAVSVNREMVETAIAQTQSAIAHLEKEAPQRDISDLKQAFEELSTSRDRQTLQGAILGGKNTGKTSVKQLLEAEISENTTWIDTEPLFSSAEAMEQGAKDLAATSDLVIFVVTGDLTDSEFQVLQALRTVHQRVLVAFNKQDCVLPEDRAVVLQQLRQRVFGAIASEDVIALSAVPSPLKVRQHQEDGSLKEWLEEQSADMGGLRDRVQSIIEQERESLLLGTTWREAMQLKATAKDILNQVRRDRAMPIIEQYQWIAAAAAFANPVAALDLLATAAISAQLLVDLGEIYQQKFSLSQAQNASGTLGKLMVKLGLVELSTQAIGSILKSHALTYVAGGAVQGVSAAYLTRLAGLSLIEYLQEQEIDPASRDGFNIERLGQVLQNVFQQNQRTAFLQNFVKQTLNRLSPQSESVDLNPATEVH